MPPPGAPQERFKCPRCGGSSFGSMILDPKDPANSPMKRYCHGDDARDGVAGCTFNWPDQDDWKYFLVNGRIQTEAEYAEVQRRIRMISVEGKPYMPNL